MWIILKEEKFSLRLLLSICLIFCQFQSGVAHKSVAYKKSMYHIKIYRITQLRYRITKLSYRITKLNYCITKLNFSLTKLNYGITKLSHRKTKLRFPITRLRYRITKLIYGITELSYGITKLRCPIMLHMNWTEKYKSILAFHKMHICIRILLWLGKLP